MGKTLKMRAVNVRSVLRWGLYIMLVTGTLGFLGAATLFLIYGSDPDMPQLDHVSDWKPEVVTRVLSSEGELIGEILDDGIRGQGGLRKWERRTLVDRQDIPPVMIHAIVDAEDAEFYKHKGLSYWGMLRAILKDLQPGAHMQGASTLTQQLVRNLLLKSNARTVRRKVQEIILARRIESKLTKDEILYLYLNLIEFGNQRFGVEEAARFYFGKSIRDIDAGEAALLASLPKSATAINPFRHPERAKDRQRYVLSQMKRYGHLSEKDAQKFAEAPIRLVSKPAPYLGVAPELVEQIKRILVTRYDKKDLPHLGLTVTTTCDAKIQKLARESVDKGLIDLDGRQGYRKPLRHLNPGKALEAQKKTTGELMAQKNPPPIFEAVITKVTSDTENHEEDGAEVALGIATVGWLPLKPVQDRYNPTSLTADKRFKPGDVVRVRIIEKTQEKTVLTLDLGPQAAVVVLDPQTREIKALVGGYGFLPGHFDRATKAKRQPGSSFKPFLYATAFATGRFTPATMLIDSPQIWLLPTMAEYKPQNAEHEAYLGSIRLRVALAKSLNTVAPQLLDVARGGVDPKDVVALAHEAGIESELQPVLSLALGASEVTPLELTNAYATFAAQGKRMSPQFIKKIDSAVEPLSSASAVEAMKPELAYLMTSMMTSVIQEGTAAGARGKIKFPAAGKTGTTNKQRDAWFVGFTPDLVTGVWVGFDDMRELGRGEQGARAALPIWVEVMNGALKGVPPKPFNQPPGIVVQRIDPKTGLLATASTPGAMDEVFLEGTQPTTESTGADPNANPDTYFNQ